MKKYFYVLIAFFVFAICSIIKLNFNVITKNNCLSLNNIVTINSAEAENSATKAESTLVTTDIRYKTVNKITYKSTRTKVDCSGTGDEDCTKSDWTAWSEYK